jgi:hypothetical protein
MMKTTRDRREWLAISGLEVMSDFPSWSTEERIQSK